MTDERIAAQAWPVWAFIHEEIIERGWDKQALAVKMGGDAREIAINLLTLDFLESVRSADLLLGEDTARRLSKAFDVSAEFFLNIDASYREWLRRKGRA